MDANLGKYGKVHTHPMVSPDKLKSKIEMSASLAASPSSLCLSAFVWVCLYCARSSSEDHCTYELVFADLVWHGV